MRRFVLMLSTFALAGLVAVPAAGVRAFPDEMPLPVNFFPEGIAVGEGHEFYAGSVRNGAIYKGDLRTGEGAILAPGVNGRAVAGLSYDGRSGVLWGVGFSATGPAVFGFDGETGTLVHQVGLPEANFPNDVVVARQALYITDSFVSTDPGPVLWTVPLTDRGVPAGPPATVPLSGDFEAVTEGALPINLNGIDVTRNGRALIAVHTSLGALYRIDPTTGIATEIDLGGAAVPFGDGIVLHGTTVYVVQNFVNQVAVIELSAQLDTGELTGTITSSLFQVPTTAARFGDSLYLVNARFDEQLPPIFGGDPDANLDYSVVEVSRH